MGYFLVKCYETTQNPPIGTDFRRLRFIQFKSVIFVYYYYMMDFVASFGNANEDHSRRRLRGLKKPPKPEDDLPTTDIAPDIPQADQPGHNIKGKVSKKPKVSAVPIESATKMPKKTKVAGKTPKKSQYTKGIGSKGQDTKESQKP
jgi:hypothetical protein